MITDTESGGVLRRVGLPHSLLMITVWALAELRFDASRGSGRIRSSHALLRAFTGLVQPLNRTSAQRAFPPAVTSLKVAGLGGFGARWRPFNFTQIWRAVRKTIIL
jgi:hypothetical protein